MNKILFFIIINFLFFNSAYASKNTTYLKCPLMMLENKGKTYPESWWPTGAQLNELYAKIKDGKKIKVSMHKYFTAKNFRQDQKPDDYDGFLKNLVFSKEDDKINWTHSESFKTKEVHGKTSDSFTFKNISGNWSLTVLEFAEYIYPDNSSQDIHIKHKLAGDCETIDKKTHKQLIKG